MYIYEYINEDIGNKMEANEFVFVVCVHMDSELMTTNKKIILGKTKA